MAINKKVLIIPDSFKDSISSKEFCDIAKKAIKKINSNVIVDCIPIGDGGEGSLEPFKLMDNFQFKKMTVKGPLNEKVQSSYCIDEMTKTCVIELAQASGIQLVPENLRNPMITTTYGTGELIKNAINKGVKKIILFIGGSATNDAGIGMLNALGYRFKDKKGDEVTASPSSLSKINKILLSPLHERIKEIEFIVACDVSNFLTGPNGATYVFGEQKGATKEDLNYLENSILHFSKIVSNTLSKNDANKEGAGAAGGVGFAAISFFDAIFSEGFSLLSKLLDLKNKIKKENYDYIITGEGKIDEQTKNGKLLKHLGSIGLEFSIPVLAFAGLVDNNLSDLELPGITKAYQITPKGLDLSSAIQNAPINLESTLYKELNILLK